MTTKQLIKLSRQMQQVEARICAKLKVENTIKGCENILHLKTASRMYENFEKVFGVSHELKNLLRLKKIQFSN